jgi:hypothetical protein
MLKLTIGLVIMFFLISCGAGDTNKTDGAEEDKKTTSPFFGIKDITVNNPLSAKVIVDSLSAKGGLETLSIDGVEVQGLSVQVKGEIVELCRSKGCWFTMQTKSGQELFFNMEEHKSIPTTSKGVEVVVEGLAYYEQPLLEEYKAAQKDAGVAAEIVDKLTEAPLEFFFLAKGVKLFK